MFIINILTSSKIHKGANKHVKRYTTSKLIREMQIKVTVRYYLTSIRMANIKQTNKHTENNNLWQRCGVIRTRMPW